MEEGQGEWKLHPGCNIREQGQEQYRKIYTEERDRELAKERREPLEKEKPWVEEGLAAQIGFRVSEASGLVTREEVWT